MTVANGATLNISHNAIRVADTVGSSSLASVAGAQWYVTPRDVNVSAADCATVQIKDNSATVENSTGFKSISNVFGAYCYFGGHGDGSLAALAVDASALVSFSNNTARYKS